MTQPMVLPRASSADLVRRAVRRSRPLSRDRLNEQAFTLAFSSLVYPQIWEDPVVDMEAMDLGPGHRVLTIASGGCNALSYLTASPAQVTAVDLNTAHIALNRLKIAALRRLETHEEFYRLFGQAGSRQNVRAFDSEIAPYLDDDSLVYWNGRDLTGRRRIERFARGFYRSGLLGRFITTGHLLARLYGKNPRRMIEARSIEEQRAIYERELKPLLEKPFVRALLDQRASLFGLGIPPAQYDALAGGRPMHEVIEERLERLATGFDLRDNYFAWQAFHRGYAGGGLGALPPYLEPQHFETVRANAGRLDVRHVSYVEHLKQQPAETYDRYILLDAQDWMTDADLSALWREITRTARPSARAIFRTAGKATILPGRIPVDIARRWHYEGDRSSELHARDRSAIYGGFHLYILEAHSS